MAGKLTLCLAIVVISAITAGISEASPVTGRVVGGVDAIQGQFPFQVSLRRGGSHKCGGSIINNYFILTAAHCTGSVDGNGLYTTYDPSAFTIRVGSTDRFEGGILVNVAKVHAHENYGNFLNDVSLLRLSLPLIYSSNIQPIKITTTPVPIGSPVVISGWGRLAHIGDVPQKLQWNTLTSISRSECKDRIKWDSDALICLDHPADNGACNGDSGGPAIYNGKLVGVAGFVYGGCGTTNPDGYADVYYHNEWITKNTQVS